MLCVVKRSERLAVIERGRCAMGVMDKIRGLLGRDADTSSADEKRSPEDEVDEEIQIESVYADIEAERSASYGGSFLSPHDTNDRRS